VVLLGAPPPGASGLWMEITGGDQASGWQWKEKEGTAGGRGRQVVFQGDAAHLNGRLAAVQAVRVGLAEDVQFALGLVGCAVAVSIQGAALAGVDARSAVQRRRVRLSEVQCMKHWQQGD